MRVRHGLNYSFSYRAPIIPTEDFLFFLLYDETISGQFQSSLSLVRLRDPQSHAACELNSRRPFPFSTRIPLHFIGLFKVYFFKAIPRPFLLIPEQEVKELRGIA